MSIGKTESSNKCVQFVTNRFWPKIFGSIKAHTEFRIQIIIEVKIFHSRQIRAKLYECQHWKWNRNQKCSITKIGRICQRVMLMMKRRKKEEFFVCFEPKRELLSFNYLQFDTFFSRSLFPFVRIWSHFEMMGRMFMQGIHTTNFCTQKTIMAPNSWRLAIKYSVYPRKP